MAQQEFEDIAAAVMQAESRGKRYKDDGKTLTTSPKGALGEMQVMPKTIRDPGFGVTPAKDKSPDEIARVGQDYLKAMLGKYGDTEKALIAYNWGPGSTDKWLTAGADPEKLPAETKTYVERVKRFLGGAPAAAPAPAPNVSRETIPAPREPIPPSLPPMAAAPDTPTPVAAATKPSAPDRLAALGPGYQAALALSFLADNDEKEDRDTEKEPGIAERYLAEMDAVPKSSGLTQFADIKIRSPFAEPSQPQMLAMGGMVRRANGSPETGEQAPTAEELEAASKPAFLTPKSGIGRKISTKPGELEAAALQGVSETPYNLVGAFVDLATMAMRPFGYTNEKPFLGSEDLKELFLKAGIRQKPPEGAAARALYEMTQFGSGLVNPAAPVRGAVKAAEKTGEAAKMLAQDFQQYNRQLDVPGASYAVRNKGTPVVMYPKRPVTTDDFLMQMGKGEFRAFKERNPEVALYRDQEVAATPDFQSFAAKTNAPIDQAEALVRQEVATTPDPTLNSWFMKALPRYLRSDFASPQDQLVQAAEQGKMLHLAPKKFSQFSDVDAQTEKLLRIKDKDIQQERRTQGFSPYGEAKDKYAQRIESLTDIAAYPEEIGFLDPNRVPPSMRNLVKTNPETRAMDFAPDISGILKLPELRDKMLEIRALGPKAEYSEYGQAPAKIPDEFLLPDDTLAKLNVAAASNRVARFTRWQDETRQGMATTSLRTEPGLNKQPLQEGKYIGVALPDVDIYPKYMPLVNDVGCDGGWCTQQEALAKTYGSGDSRLHIIVTGEGNKARPVAQISVEKVKRKNGSAGYNITEIKEKGDTNDFLNNPALPAIQEYVQSLDNTYGGLQFVSDLGKLGMTQLPKNPMELFNPTIGAALKFPLEKAFGSEAAGLAAVKDEAIRLNNGSQYVIDNKDDVFNLLNRALGNVLTPPQQRATGGMIERQSADNRRYL
tara:strand:- start:4251 stop:7085 length:2835 start_codon:yes stop_codon:yes gene_type:complete